MHDHFGMDSSMQVQHHCGQLDFGAADLYAAKLDHSPFAGVQYVEEGGYAALGADPYGAAYAAPWAYADSSSASQSPAAYQTMDPMPMLADQWCQEASPSGAYYERAPYTPPVGGFEGFGARSPAEPYGPLSAEDRDLVYEFLQPGPADPFADYAAAAAAAAASSSSAFYAAPAYAAAYAAAPAAAAAKPDKPKPKKKPTQNCHMNSVCSMCGTTDTTLWRRNVKGDVECNACNLYYRKNQTARPLKLQRRGIMKRARNPRQPVNKSTTYAQVSP